MKALINHIIPSIVLATCCTFILRVPVFVLCLHINNLRPECYLNNDFRHWTSCIQYIKGVPFPYAEVCDYVMY